MSSEIPEGDDDAPLTVADLPEVVIEEPAAPPLQRTPAMTNGNWDGAWSADHNKFTGTYTFPNGRKFEGDADWVTVRRREHISATGKVQEIVDMPILPHWEYTGKWIRKDGRGASAPHMPEPPEERDNGEPPPEVE